MSKQPRATGLIERKRAVPQSPAPAEHIRGPLTGVSRGDSGRIEVHDDVFNAVRVAESHGDALRPEPSRPRWIRGFTRDRRNAGGSIDLDSDLHPRAPWLIEPRRTPSSQLAIVGPLKPPRDLASDGIAVEIVSIAPPAANVAVTFAERRDRSVMASIQNYGSLEAKTTARLILEGKELARADVTVAPLASADVELTARLPRTGRAEIRIDDGPGYQLDNVRHFLLDSLSAIPILVIVADPTGSTGGLYLERALNVAGGGREFRVDVLDGRAVAKWAPDDLARRAVVFVLGTRTLDRAGRDLLKTYIGRGGQVFVALGPDVDAGTISDSVGVPVSLAEAPVRTLGATLVASDGRHPIFRPFLNPSGALGDVQVEQYRRLNDQRDRTVLARFSGGDPALTEQAVGEGRLMIYTSDLDNQWSRFPLNPAFVPFAVETARYLSRGQAPPGSI